MDPSNVANPVLTFTAFNSAGSPTACKAVLTVRKNAIVLSSIADVVVNGCVFDCKGILNGPNKIDQCGVCAGDNSTCQNCKNFDNTGNQLALDTNAKQMETLVRNTGRGLLRFAGASAQNKAIVKKANREAHKLYLATWTTVWTKLPSLVLDCNQSVCQTVSNLGTLATIKSGLGGFEKVLSPLRKRLIASGLRGKRSASSTLRRYRALFRAGVAVADKVPATTSSCPK